MVKVNQPHFTTLDGRKYVHPEDGGRFSEMVKAVDALRDRLVDELPYNHDEYNQKGFIPNSTPLRDVNFEVDERIKSNEIAVHAPQIRWSSDIGKELGKSSFKGVLGVANSASNTITLNAWADKDQILDVVRHEYAHLAEFFISRVNSSHGRPFRKWAIILGTRPTHNTSAPDYDFLPKEKRVGKLESKLWLKPLKQIEDSLPHDVVYENVSLVSDLVPVGRFTKRLIALHPDPHVAMMIATNPYIEDSVKLEVLTRDTLPAKLVNNNWDDYRNSIEEKIGLRTARDFDRLLANNPRGSILDFGMHHSVHSELSSLSADELKAKHGDRFVEARRDALQRILDEDIGGALTNPTLHRYIKADLADAERVLGAHRDIGGAEIDSPRVESYTTEDSVAKIQSEIQSLGEVLSLSDIADESESYKLTRLQYAENLEKLAINYALKAEMLVRIGENDKALKAMKEAGKAYDSIDDIKRDSVKDLRDGRITQSEHDSQIKRLDNLLQSARERLSDSGYAIHKRMPYELIYIGGDTIRSLVLPPLPAPKEQERGGIFHDMIDDWHIASQGSSFPDYDGELDKTEWTIALEDVNWWGQSPTLKQQTETWIDVSDDVSDDGNSQPVTSDSVASEHDNGVDDYIPQPIQADIPPPVLEPERSALRNKPNDSQLAWLAIYARYMPDLAGIARDAESYSADEADAVLNDLAKELYARGRRKSTIRKTVRSERSYAPRGR